MNTVNNVLELVKEEHITIGELEKKLGAGLREFGDAIEFLGSFGLIDLLPSGNEEGPWVQITPRGLQLLNLPNLPEDETTGDEITELTLIEQKIADKTINLYSLSQLTETANWIDNMAMRFNVRPEDVTRALWLDGKTTVWAKLEQSTKEKKKK